MKKLCYSTLLVFGTILLFSYKTNAACTASFTHTAPGLTINFTNTSTNSSGSTARMSYFWDFGDSTSSTLKNPVKTYSSAGWKIVQLTIYDSSTGCVSSSFDTLHIYGSACRAGFTFSLDGLFVYFVGNSTNANGDQEGLSYLWNFGDGTTSTLKDIIHVYSFPGPRLVTLSIYDSLTGCNSTYNSDTIFVQSKCNASFILDSLVTSVAYFINTSLNSNGTDTGLSYLWDFGDSTTSILKYPIKIYSSVGLKIVSLSISDSVTGCFSTYIDTIYVLGTHCNASYDYFINGPTVSFYNLSTSTDGSSSGLNYLWDFGDGTTSTQKDPIKIFQYAGFHYALLSIYDSAQSCWSQALRVVSSSAPPLCFAHFDVAPDSTTPFSFFILNNSTVRPTSSFLWDFGDGTTSTLKTPTHSYTSFGRYNVCLTVFDSICTSTFCDSIGMDSNGVLLQKSGAFGFKTIDQTTLSPTTGISLSEVVKGSVKIYPNPGNEVINVSFTSNASGPVQFELFDITGKVIHTTEFVSKPGENTETLNLSEYKPSIYFLKIITNSGTQVHKIIKN